MQRTGTDGTNLDTEFAERGRIDLHHAFFVLVVPMLIMLVCMFMVVIIVLSPTGDRAKRGQGKKER
ncbi:MAG: hypothetical protein Q7P63_06285 [Verrucomicrobiota bacterium JB022]|nr:hypothetical protein [Verrucomicrobiota bacterium JB022]